MRKRSFVLCLGACGSLFGCTDGNGSAHTTSLTDDLGSVRLGIALAPGLDIETVAYSIQVPDHEAIQGTLPVGADGVVRGKVDDVPASTSVLVSLTAGTAAGVTCSGEGTTTVRAGETATLSIGLQCRLPTGTPVTTGSIEVSGSFNVCPRLLTASADPASTADGTALTASGEDLDGDPISFSWAATAGSFGAANAASTTYDCATAGQNTLTVTVDDGRGCTHSSHVIVTCTGVASAADSLRGGALYDSWASVKKVTPPSGDHPLWSQRPDLVSNTLAGAGTWRCKECHGWDYKGVQGAYAKGSHKTGFAGILGTTKTEAEIIDSLKVKHGYGAAGLTEMDLQDLARFVTEGLIETDQIIDAHKAFKGDPAKGQPLFASACQSCHGEDGLNTQPAGFVGVFEEFPGKIAAENPWEFQHKVRFGQPGSVMPPQLRNLTVVQLGDLGAHVQTLPEAL